MEDRGATPLHYAVSHGNKAAVLALLAQGANPEIRNRQNRTAIDLAREDNKPILTLFAKQGEHFGGLVSEKPGPLMVAEGGEPKQLAHIRGMSLLEFSNVYYPNVRFQNVMISSLTEGALPYETVGAYLDAGERARQALLKLPNLGLGSINRLNKAIDTAMRQSLPVSNVEVDAPVTKRKDLAEQLETRFPGVFAPLLNGYANTPVSERADSEELEANILRLLTVERLAEVASRRFHGETLAQISQSLGVTRERVRQIEKQAKPWMAEPNEDEQLEEDNGEPEAPVPEGLRRKWYETYLRLQAYQAQHGSIPPSADWSSGLHPRAALVSLCRFG